MLRPYVWFRAPAVRAIRSDPSWTIRRDPGVLVGDVSLFTAGRLTRTPQDWAVTGPLLPSESQRRPYKTSFPPRAMQAERNKMATVFVRLFRSPEFIPVIPSRKARNALPRKQIERLLPPEPHALHAPPSPALQARLRVNSFVNAF